MFDPVQQQIFMGILIVGVFLCFLRAWLPVELVALSAFFACVVAGILPLSLDPSLPPEERAGEMKYLALGIFAHPAPITVACMFILSAALERTGVVEALGQWFERVAATSPVKMMIALMVVVAFLSGFVNNTPVVVVFMPVILAICRRKDWKASRYLIPLSYAAIVGGTITIVGTSTNLVVAGTWTQHLPDRSPFAMFEFASLGLVFVAVTLVYMLTLGRRLLPDRVTLAALIDSEQSREFITHAFVGGDSPLVGKAYPDSPLARMRKARVLEVVREGRRIPPPLDEMVFQEGDEIVFQGEVDGLAQLHKKGGVKIRGGGEIGLEAVRTESTILMEGVVGRGALMEDKSLRELDFEQNYGVRILAVHRRGRHLKERFEDVKLAFGDTLLVQGPTEKMNRLFKLKAFINLSRPQGRILRWNKAPLAVTAIAVFMLMGALMGFGVIPSFPVEALAMGAALLVLLTRCIEPQEAYQAIEWKVLFLIMGMLGLGLAVERSGLGETIANGLLGTVGAENPVLLIAGLYLLAALLTELISNNAVAALLAPLAIIIGQSAELDPKPLVVAVMFGASASFLTPIGYQTNTLVYGAGGYKFSDFGRVGLPLAIILWVIASFLIPYWWPLR